MMVMEIRAPRDQTRVAQAHKVVLKLKVALPIKMDKETRTQVQSMARNQEPFRSTSSRPGQSAQHRAGSEPQSHQYIKGNQLSDLPSRYLAMLRCQARHQTHGTRPLRWLRRLMQPRRTSRNGQRHMRTVQCQLALTDLRVARMDSG